MSRIKVAHVTTADISLRYLLLDQMRSLQRAGYEVVGISSPGPDVPAVEAAGIRHVPVPMTRNFTPGADLVSLYRLYRVMRRERPTIVHTHNPKPGLIGQLAARAAGVPVVVNTVHGFYFHDHMPRLKRRFYVTTEKVAALCSDLILSQNREDLRTAIRERICPPRRLVELGNGIALGDFDPGRFSAADVRRQREDVSIPDGAKVVGFVGRLAARRKGFLDFLRAGEEVARRVPGVRFLIVGGSDLGKPDAVDPVSLKGSPIWGACHFLGPRPNAELPRLYAAMDVLVLPSLFEGIPRVVMEASAMGLPCVVSDVKGNREAVEHGRTGFVVPLGDVPALADAVVAVLADGDRAERMGAAARQRAVERFDERLVFEKVKAEYVRLLRSKGFLVPASEVRPSHVPTGW